MNDQLPITLVRLAIAVLVLRQVGLKTFTEAFRTVEREVLRGAPDLPPDSNQRRY